MTDTDWLTDATDEELEEADEIAKETYGDQDDNDQDK